MHFPISNIAGFFPVLFPFGWENNLIICSILGVPFAKHVCTFTAAMDNNHLATLILQHEIQFVAKHVKVMKCAAANNKAEKVFTFFVVFAVLAMDICYFRLGVRAISAHCYAFFRFFCIITQLKRSYFWHKPQLKIL